MTSISAWNGIINQYHFGINTKSPISVNTDAIPPGDIV